MNVTLACPSCGSDGEHQVLHEARERVVKCSRCGFVHRVPMEEGEKRIPVRTIVSSGSRSRVCTCELLPEEECSIGDLLVAECGEDAVGVTVTDIETGEGRENRARAARIVTIWSREVEKVVVNVSVHRGRITIPLRIPADGDALYRVGERYRAGKVSFRVSHMKLRDGRTFRKEGEEAPARDIKRLYGYIL